MNLYHIRDTDGGNEVFIVATDIRVAIDMFENSYGYTPETIRNFTADGGVVLVEGLVKETEQ